MITQKRVQYCHKFYFAYPDWADCAGRNNGFYNPLKVSFGYTKA